MQEILDKHRLTVSLNEEKSELTIFKDETSIFLEAELTADDWDLIKKGDLKKVLATAIKIQLECDFEACIEDADEITYSVMKYMNLCFTIYNELI
jgi:hypothetical protein